MLLATAMAVVAASASVANATSQLKVIGSGSGAGDYAVTAASGTANHPHVIYVRVTASPAQSVLVSWDLVCSKGFSAGSKSGQFNARTPVMRALKMPMNGVSSCIVSADAQLSGSGRLTVQVLQS